jgi:hypothetical protein
MAINNPFGSTIADITVGALVICLFPALARVLKEYL